MYIYTLYGLLHSMYMYMCIDVRYMQNDQMASQRETDPEKRALERAVNDVYSDIRRAAEAHRYMYIHVYMYIISTCIYMYMYMKN